MVESVKEIERPLHTNQWLSSPVILVVEDVSVSVKQVGEEFPQVVVVGLLEKVQSTHIPQVGGHLFCCTHQRRQTDRQTQKKPGEGLDQQTPQ